MHKNTQSIHYNSVDIQYNWIVKNILCFYQNLNLKYWKIDTRIECFESINDNLGATWKPL